ncbi:MAG TPA: ATP-binding protein [Armatimonadota bacterium]|nr:ATP-binding protein [Armatimonadota bacterium]
MFTEVQIKKCDSHLARLRRIVSCIGAGLGMSRKEIEETENAVNEACLRTADSSSDGSVSVKLGADDSHMTVEVTDPYSDSGAACSGDSQHDAILERIGHLVDRVEVVRGPEAITVVITKYAAKQDPALSRPVRYLASLSTTSLQS